MKNDLIFDEARLAKNIRQARIQSGLTQSEVAQKLNVRQQHVFEWENNKRGLAAKYLLMMRKVLGEEIFEGVVMTEYESNMNAIERGKTRTYTFNDPQGFVTVFTHGKDIRVQQGKSSFAFLGKLKWSKDREQQLLDGVNPVNEGWETLDGEPLAYVDMSSLL